MADPAAKRDLFEGFARVGKALGSPARLELLDVLAQGERSVDELARETGTTVATCSAHLQVLRRTNLVTTRRDGTRVHYRLAGDDVRHLVDAVRTTADARIAEIPALARAYLGDDVESLTRDELLDRAARGNLLIIDVRPTAEYEAGHIPDALSVPVDDLEQHLDRLPTDVEIVAYCRGPYCVFAHDAVRRLTDAGFTARRLRDGLPQWRAAGLPVATGPA